MHQPPPLSKTLAIALALGASMGYSALGIFSKPLGAEGVSIATMLTWRFGLTCLILSPLIVRDLFKVRTRDLFAVVLLGLFGFSLQAATYVSAITHIGVGTAAVLIYLYPSFVIVLEWLFGGKPLVRRQVALLLLSWVGSILVVNPTAAQVSLTGFCLAILTALIYSLYLFFGHFLNRTVSPALSSWGVSLGAWLGFFSFSLWNGQIESSFSSSTWQLLLGMVVVSTVFPMTAVFFAMRRLGPTNTALLSMTEPLFAVVLGMVFLQESLGPLQMVGGALIITSAWTLAREQQSISDDPDLLSH